MPLPIGDPFSFFITETVLIGAEVIKRRPPSGNNVAPGDGNAVISNVIEQVVFLKSSKLYSCSCMIYRACLASFVAFIVNKMFFGSDGIWKKSFEDRPRTL